MKHLLLMPFLLVGLACGAPASTPAARPSEPFRPSLALRPTSIALLPGATQDFQAEINYPEGVRPLRQPVAWSVVEAEGGTVTPSGHYTAPAHAGTFHVQARRQDFPEVMATATVTVQ